MLEGLLLCIALIFLGIGLYITRMYFKSEDNLMEKAKWKKYLNLIVAIELIICLLFFILEII